MKTIYKIASILAVCLLAFAVIPWQASADEVKTPKTEELKVTNQKELDALLAQYKEIAANYGYSFDGTPMFNDTIRQANFPTLSEFEASLQPVGEEVETSDNGQIPLVALASVSNGTKTYKKVTKMPVFSFISTVHKYAKVTRKKGKVTKVKKWSEVTGLNYPIKMTQTKTWHKLNKAKTHGKAYFRFKKYKYIIPGYPDIGFVSYVTGTPVSF